MMPSSSSAALLLSLLFLDMAGACHSCKFTNSLPTHFRTAPPIIYSVTGICELRFSTNILKKREREREWTINRFVVLPYAQFVGARAYLLQQKMECKGGKVYDIDNVQVGKPIFFFSNLWRDRTSNNARKLVGSSIATPSTCSKWASSHSNARSWAMWPTCNRPMEQLAITLLMLSNKEDTTEDLDIMVASEDTEEEESNQKLWEHVHIHHLTYKFMFLTVSIGSDDRWEITNEIGKWGEWKRFRWHWARW